MTSKEIVKAHIEQFEKCRKAYLKASDIETANAYASDIEIFKIILQDLERLEQLEQENQELKVKADKYDSAQRIVLSTKGIDVMMKLQAENEKLEKTLEILKEEFFIDLIEREKDYKLGFVPKVLDNEKSLRFSALSKEKGDLLKEMLRDEN